jgi:DNA primase
VHALLTHPDWWDQLTAEDHELLLALPAPHGPLLAWLERDLAEHGARAWAVLRTALQADERLAEPLRQTLSNDPADDDAPFSDLRQAMNQCLLAHLQARLKLLVSQPSPDAQTLEQYRAIEKRCQQLRARHDAADSPA